MPLQTKTENMYIQPLLLKQNPKQKQKHRKKPQNSRMLQSLLPTNHKAKKTTAQATRIMVEIREMQEIQAAQITMKFNKIGDL